MARTCSCSFWGEIVGASGCAVLGEKK
jgi:hypothetical protein